MKKVQEGPKARFRKIAAILLFTTVLLMAMFATFSAQAQTMAVRSALVAPGEIVSIPIEISSEIKDVFGFQLDLAVSPSPSAPPLTIENLAKGQAITINPDLDAYPSTPTWPPIRLGLPTEVPAIGDMRPYFNGPGTIIWVELAIPASAQIGQSYQIDLTGVILAGPGNQAIPLTVFPGTLTVGSTSALADSLSAPPALFVNEGQEEPLTITVTGAGLPIPGVSLNLAIEDQPKATLNLTTTTTGADGQAVVMVKGLEDGTTQARISSPGLGEIAVDITIYGISPIITSSPPLEVAQGSVYVYDVEAQDPQNDVLTYQLILSPGGMTIDEHSGLIQWTPSLGQPTTGNEVTVEVRDPSGNRDTQSFHILITIDADGDGFDSRTDCDDLNPFINPGVSEIPYDGIDNDCTLVTPDDDLDGDGFLLATDCNDINPLVHPGAQEILYNGLDDDCDPATLDMMDEDGDGYLTQQNQLYPKPADCDDHDPEIHPDAVEIPYNGLDDDCDPTTPDNWSASFMVAIDEGGRIYFSQSLGDGSFSQYQLIEDIGDYKARAIASADFDGDRDLDFIAGGGVNGRVDYFLFLNDGTNHFLNQGLVVSRQVSGTYAQDMAAGDLNHDGLMDFVAGTDSTTMILALGDGQGGFSVSETILSGNNRGCDLSDLNLDGHLDLIRGNNLGEVYLYLGNGDGTFGGWVFKEDIGTDACGIMAADFDGDSLADIIANNGSSGNATLFKNNGNGSFTKVGLIPSLDPDRYSAFDGYDFNNDGKTDTILSDYNNRKIWFYPGLGDGTFGTRVQLNTTNTQDYVLAVSAPPYRLPGLPYALIKPQQQSIPLGGTANFDASRSGDEDGLITNWEWNFGDGATGNGQIISHTYGQTESTFLVTLMVTDNQGKKSFDKALVYVKGAPPVARSGGPYTFGEDFAHYGLYTVTLDGSASTDDTGIVQYDWDFGDGGIGEGQNSGHVYNAAGTYIVTLKVTDQAGQTATDTTEVTLVKGEPPIAQPGGNLLLTESDGFQGTWTIFFDGSLSTDDVGLSSFEWDFGDVTQGTGIQIAHLYQPAILPAVYQVKLKVTDHALQTHTAEMTVTIDLSANLPPSANPGGPYVANEEAAQAGLWQVFFNASASFDQEGLARYVWDFGDWSSLTTWCPKERLNFFEAGTSLYGYDVPEAGLYILACQNNTMVKVINLETGEVVKSATLNKNQEWSGGSPGDGIYFKVEADKPVLAYETEGKKHSTFIPSLDAGPVGQEFLFHLFTGDGFHIFAIEDALVRVTKTNGTLVLEQMVRAGNYLSPALAAGVYQVVSTGKVALQVVGGTGFTTVPSITGQGTGKGFFCATYAENTGALAVFAYEQAEVSVFDLDSGDLIFSRALGQGEAWWQTGVGSRRLSIRSNGEIEVWAGDTKGGSEMINFGDDLSFAGGRDGQEFYLHSLMEGAVIFAPFENTKVKINDLEQTMKADGYLPLAGEAFYHITADKPIIIQLLGQAGSWSNCGTYLGGLSQVYHRYASTGTYNVTLTVYDQANQAHSAGTTVTVAASEAPVADIGGPYLLNEASAQGGIWRCEFEAGGSTDDFGIYRYEWDFDNRDGFQVQGTTANPVYFYTQPGTYTVTLKVYDHALQMTEVTTQVTVQANDPPLAKAGGPYLLGEETAREGKYIVTFDGTASSDDFGLRSYTWDFGELMTEDFNGQVINDEKWICSEGVIQDGLIRVTGASDWGNRYCFSQESFRREGGNVFSGRVKPSNGISIWGLKSGSALTALADFPYTICLYQGIWRIYEDGQLRGSKGNYTLNQWYDLKIELKPQKGALYYVRLSGQLEWTLLFESEYAPYTPLFRVGCLVNTGILEMDDIRIEARGDGAKTTHVYKSPGTYEISLTVRDQALQENTESTTLTLTSGQAPLAEAGGPYTGELFSLVQFNGSLSSDDNRIARYVWDFGDGCSAEGVGPNHFYRQNGTYTVTLTVYDNLLQSASDQAQVTIGQGNPPQAEAGGPYQGGVGGPPVYFNGLGSRDDEGILSYTWQASLLNEDFSGSQISTPPWHYGVSSGGSITQQSGELLIKGRPNTASFGSAYVVSTFGLNRDHDLSFSGRVKTIGGPGYFLVGWKDETSSYSQVNFEYAFYFMSNNSLMIYENGSSRGSFGTYQNDTWYKFRIELKEKVACYYLNDVLIYNSAYAGESRLKPGLSAATKIQAADDWQVEVTLLGQKPFFTFPLAGDYPVTLTVEDGAGQVGLDTALVEIFENFPPKVICVPWVGTDPKFPHETWNGKEITLKGVVKDAKAIQFQWDFGDGTSSPKMPMNNSYDLSVKHTYPEAPEGTPFVATLSVWDSQGEVGSDTYPLVVKEKNLEVEVNVGLDEALWYLFLNQDRSGLDEDGRWGGYSGYYVSPTGSVLQAFQINSHLESGDPAEDPYVEAVSRGLKYLFTKLRSKAIGPQVYGNPDTNANGIGIEVSESHPVYQGGMVMMAIAASGTPLAKTRAGGEDIAHRFYYDLLVDMADMYIWGQSDRDKDGGGWRYTWNADSDNSVCQWAALGLSSAEEAFHIPVPDWVKERNLVWLDYSTGNYGIGFGYSGPGQGVATTPSGLAQLAFDGISTSDWRWQGAETFLAAKWDEWYFDTQNYYALYALAKAFRIAQPEEVTIIGQETSLAIDWYHDSERGVARTVLDDQKPDGSFALEGQGTDSLPEGPFRTAWGVVILSRTLFVKPPMAEAGSDRVFGIDWELTLDGSASYHTDPFRRIVLYEWDVDGDGRFDTAGTSPIASHTYHELGTYTVTLRVTDDNIPPKTDTDTALITIAIPPHPPIAVAGGPYRASTGLKKTLDASGSFDIDPSDSITRCGWEIDGIYPYDFDDAVGQKPDYTWLVPGTYSLGLKVWDNGVMNDLDGDGEVDEDERLTNTQWTTITVVQNQAPIAQAGGPYSVDEGMALVLDASGSLDPDGHSLTYAWDLDGDGEFDDAQGINPSYLFSQNGLYTISLKVSDTALEDTATASVTVNDLKPTAQFSCTPSPQDEGQEVSFINQSTSPVDTIASWHWDFGGQGTSAQENPSFRFNDDGLYTITLLVIDHDGSTSSVSHQVIILDKSPIAVLTGDTDLTEGSLGNFWAGQSFSSPDAIVKYEWDWDYNGLVFQPSGGSVGIMESHIFLVNGDYTVAVRVTDEDGSTAIATLRVYVEPAAPQPVQTIFNLTARAKDRKIDLAWSRVLGVSTYNIYRSTTKGGPYTLLKSGHVTTYCAYADFGLTNGLTYYYVVTSVANGLESLYSNEASAKPMGRVR